MNFLQLQTEVRTRLNELTAVFWTDDDIKDALNEGLRELADGTEYFERSAAIACSDRTYMDLRGMAEEPLTVLSVWNPEQRRWLNSVNIRELDDSRAEWETVSAEPQSWFIRGSWWLGTYPKRDGEGVLHVVYTAIPPEMVYDDDVPAELPIEFHFALVDYALADCLAQERETKKAVAYLKSYDGYAARLTAHVDRRTALDRRIRF